MRQIIIEVPDKECNNCMLLKQERITNLWACPYTKRAFHPYDRKPVKACRDAEVKA